MAAIKCTANWIVLGIAMLIIQVLLGGITRLTGSGLSITEWKPLMGALPPMNEAQWQKAFNGYQQIAQFKYLNRHFSLSDFKFIFFLGVVSPFMGTNYRSGVSYTFYLVFNKRIF